MVLEGAHGDGSRSAMRTPGWETLPRGSKPIQVDSWYPRGGVSAATTVDIQDDKKPEIVAPLNDGFIRAFGADANEIWHYVSVFSRFVRHRAGRNTHPDRSRRRAFFRHE